MADDKSERPTEEQAALAGLVFGAVAAASVYINKWIKGDQKSK